MRKELLNADVQTLKRFANIVVANLLGNIDVFYSVTRSAGLPLAFEGAYREMELDESFLDKDKAECLLGAIDETKTESKEFYIDVIRMIFEDKTLFEAFCIAYFDSDEHLAEFLEVLGYEDKLIRLEKNVVYLMRRDYISSLIAIIKATMKLYGVISIEEIYEVIMYYMKDSFAQTRHEEFTRKRGNYKVTVFADPMFFSIEFLYIYLQTCGAELLVTPDGLVMDGCFADEYQREVNDVMKAADEGKSAEEIFDVIDDDRYAYRRFYIENIDKPLYLPDDIFYHADEEQGYENVDSEEELFDYLLELSIRFKDKASNYEDDDARMYEIIRLIDIAVQGLNDHNVWLEGSVTKAHDMLCHELNDLGVKLKKDEKIKLMILLSDYSEDIRLWRERGYTAREVKEGKVVDHLTKIDDLFSEMFADDGSIKMIAPKDEHYTDIDPKTGEKIIKIKRSIYEDGGPK